jgi:hypothetical protein
MLEVVDQLPDLEKLLFFNFGEPFLHPDAVPFLHETRRRRPGLVVHTSANRLALLSATIEGLAAEALAAEALADGVARSGILCSSSRRRCRPPARRSTFS